jgi:hypothetical protein
MPIKKVIADQDAMKNKRAEIGFSEDVIATKTPKAILLSTRTHQVIPRMANSNMFVIS